MDALQPDPAAINQWMATWFAKCDAGNIELAWSDPQTGKVNRARQFALGNPEIGEIAAQLNRTPNVNVYYMAATTRSADNRRSCDDDVVQSPGFWIDQDSEEHVRATDNILPMLRPQWWIVTGRTPYLRRHGYFLTDEVIREESVIRNFNDRLISLYRCDKTTVNPSRLLRCPYTIAWPSKRGAPIPGRIPELTYFTREDLCAPDHYTRAHLDLNLPRIAEAPERKPLPAQPSSPVILPDGERVETFDELFAKLQTSAFGRHDTLNRLIASMMTRGMPDSAIIDLLAQPKFNVPDHAGRAMGDAEWHEEVSSRVKRDRASGKFGAPDPDPPATTAYDHVRQNFQPITQDTDPTAEPRTYGTLSLSQMVIKHGPPPEWLIHGVIPRRDVTLLSGLPGAGKSPIAQMWVAHLITGQPWDERPSVPCNVCYVARESEGQTARNIHSMVREILEAREGLPRDSITEPLLDHMLSGNFISITSRAWNDEANPPFFIETEMDILIATLEKECRPGGQFAGGEPDLTVIDTLRAASVGSLSDDKDMSVVQREIARLKARFPNMAVLLLTHAAKAQPGGVSGTNRIDGFSDNIFSVILTTRDADIDDDDAVKRPKNYGPDSEGYVYRAMKLLHLRYKNWQTLRNTRITARIKESHLSLLVGEQGSRMLETATNGKFTSVVEPEAFAASSQQNVNILTINDEANITLLLLVSTTHKGGVTTQFVADALKTMKLRADIQRVLRIGHDDCLGAVKRRLFVMSATGQLTHSVHNGENIWRYP